MSGCGSCGSKNVTRVNTLVRSTVNNQPAMARADASENPKNLVRLRYYGGGMALKDGTGCRACSSGGQYALTTAETIMFTSVDAPDGTFKQYFQVGRDYYVTEKQAEYLLKLTFVNPAGQTVNKFKRMEGLGA